jgi:transcriptional regulator with AAA-type ATPase domain
LKTVKYRTARLRDELQAADRQARLSHQLTLLGQFTAGFLHEFNNPLAIVVGRIEVLLEERWPGNVRQLKNVMERLAALHAGGELCPEDLRDEFPASRPANDFSALTWRDARERYLADFEVSYAQAVLAAAMATLAQVDEMCLSCHEGKHAEFDGSAHSNGNVSCISCHAVHTAAVQKHLLKGGAT